MDRRLSEAPRHFYVPELDGLRFLAFLAVFVFHVPQIAFVPRISPSWNSLEWWGRGALLAGVFGVDLFFVLSGFLITSLLLRESESRGRINVPAFWMRRALRIWPLYYAYVGLCALFEWLPARTFATFALFIGNWPVAEPAPDRSLIGVLWSVQIEEQFYLVWPFILAVVPQQSLRLVCAGMLAVSLACRVLLLADGGGGLERLWFHTMARLDPIAIGALIALTWCSRPVFGLVLRVVVGLGAPLLIVASTGLLVNQLLRPDAQRAIPLLILPGAGYIAATVLMFPVVAVACGGILLAALSARGSWLGHPLLVYLGRISYGLYVFHYASIRLVEPLWWPWRGLLGFGITLALAAVSYRFFERPFLRFKERFAYVGTAPWSAPARVVAETGPHVVAIPP